MESIYVIEDINGLKYVGRTKLKLNKRLSGHKNDKKRCRYCSSSKLDLENCEITCLDNAESPEEARELEEFYINSIECVNDRKFNDDRKQYREKNKEKKREYDKKYGKKNKERKKEYMKEYYEKNKDEINRKRREHYKITKLKNNVC